MEYFLEAVIAFSILAGVCLLAGLTYKVNLLIDAILLALTRMEFTRAKIDKLIDLAEKKLGADKSSSILDNLIGQITGFIPGIISMFMGFLPDKIPEPKK